MSKLTRAQIKRYIKSNGDHCPYCNSKDLSPIGNLLSEEVTPWKEASKVEEEIACRSCGKHRFDQMSLTGIAENDVD